MAAAICYMGDGSLSGAAGYLAAIMQQHDMDFDYVPSCESPPPGFASTPYRLYVISDYPAARFGPGEMPHIARRVQQGAGLVMLGGWESYHGRLGEYFESPLVEVLPVVMGRGDDRCNCAQPCLINRKADHPILGGLPWDQPAGIGGFNRFRAKPVAQTLLTSIQFSVFRTDGEAAASWRFSAGEEWPLLVVGQYGLGRTAALATDVAPHWVGGLVDWGDRRVIQDVAGEQVEVGNCYATFFANLLRWTMADQAPRTDIPEQRIAIHGRTG